MRRLNSAWGGFCWGRIYSQNRENIAILLIFHGYVDKIVKKCIIIDIWLKL